MATLKTFLEKTENHVTTYILENYIDTWLSRCGIAEWPSIGFSPVSPTKVEARSCIENRKHLVNFLCHTIKVEVS